MHRAIRSQIDDKQELYSALTALNCTGDPGQTRQEFAQEADVNYQLARFGVGTQLRGPGMFTETRYDLDLQSAIHAIEDARAAHSRLPADLQEKYPTYQSMLSAIDRGELTTLKPKEDAQPVSGAAAPSSTQPGTTPA